MFEAIDPLDYGTLAASLARTVATYGKRPALVVPPMPKHAYHPNGIEFTWAQTAAAAAEWQARYAAAPPPDTRPATGSRFSSINAPSSCSTISRLTHSTLARAIPYRAQKKLVEESREVFAAENRDHVIAELADVAEVILAIIAAIGARNEDVEQERLARFARSEGFADRVFLRFVDIREPQP